MVFFKSKSTRQFLSWERLISLTTFLYRHKLTWQVDVQRCKKLHATNGTVAKGKAKMEMSPFSWLYKFPLKHFFKPDVVLVKTCKLEHLFSENSLSFLNHNLVPRGSVVFGIYNFSLCLQQNTLNEDSDWRQCNNCCPEKRIPNTQNNYPFTCLSFIC